MVNMSRGMVTSIRTIIAHFGKFVHPENNPGLCDKLIRTIVAHYCTCVVTQYSGFD